MTRLPWRVPERRFASRGGKASAKALTAAERTAIGKKGAEEWYSKVKMRTGA